MQTKIILITGASSGIGKATAELLLEEGHKVYGAARNEKEMDWIKDKGGIVVVLDMSKPETLGPCVEKIIAEQGRIDVLFNNAGFGLFGSIEETSIEATHYQFEVNLFGLARLTQLVLPHMRKQSHGLIVNTSSMGGKIVTPLGAWYHASKHALEGWSDCLRLEVKQFGIDVVIIEPGIIETAFANVFIDLMQKTSGSGPYKELAEKMVSASKASYAKGKGTPALVIAKTVSKAISSKNPKIRYIVGKRARLLLFIRKWLGDRIYDWLIMTSIS